MNVVFNKKQHETKAGTINELLKEMDVNPETVIVKKNGEIVSETEKLKDGDAIETLKIISGG
jgi:thiamine biosynthesis protein ThiS